MGGDVQIRNYAVSAGDRLEDSWALTDFSKGVYRLEVHGPNGFYREFTGGGDDPAVEIKVLDGEGEEHGPNGNIDVMIRNLDPGRAVQVEITDKSYQRQTRKQSIAAGESAKVTMDTGRSHRWYDFVVAIAGSAGFGQRFAGRVETGAWSFSDPAMGRVDGF
jgi:phospholipase C